MEDIIELTNQPIEDTQADTIVLGMIKGEQNKVLKNVDLRLKGVIQNSLDKGQFTGKFKEILNITTNDSLPSKRLIVVGLGNKEDITLDHIRKAAGFAVKTTRDMNQKKININLSNIDVPGADSEKILYATIEGAMLGNYQFTQFKTDKSEIKLLEKILITSIEDPSISMPILSKAVTICTGTILTRDLVNLPANYANSEYLQNIATQIDKENPKVKVSVYGKDKMRQLEMNAILGVNQGSAHEPKLVIIDYTPEGTEDDQPIVLVGKGVTFDSGGLSLKPPKYMEDMKTDMGGAAVVISTLKTVAKLGIKRRVIGVTPLVENMTGSNAQRPGDIVTAYNKKTIEVLNTDAEGRLILADALSYSADKLKPKYMIDLCTLTGAAIVALGVKGAALLGTDKELIEKIKKSAENTDEKLWELPLWPEFTELMKSDQADLRNIAKSVGMIPGAGTSTAAAFLKEFVGDTKWAHIDIAGPTYIPEDNDYIPSNATGYGVRLMVDLIEQL